VSFDATTCNITGSRAGGNAYNSNKSLSLTLGSVSSSAFTGDGSTSDGGVQARGGLRISCLKYAHENIRLTLTSSSVLAVPSQGVVLTDPSVDGRSSNVGVQLSYCLSGVDYLDAHLGVQSCPTTPFPLGVDVGSARTPGVEFLRSGGPYRFGGTTNVNPDIDQGLTHIYLLARYYQVGTGAAQPGIVQTNYTLTLDNL
jgi:type 1 fimbria pilin